MGTGGGAEKASRARAVEGRAKVSVGGSPQPCLLSPATPAWAPNLTPFTFTKTFPISVTWILLISLLVFVNS